MRPPILPRREKTKTKVENQPLTTRQKGKIRFVHTLTIMRNVTGAYGWVKK